MEKNWAIRICKRLLKKLLQIKFRLLMGLFEARYGLGYRKDWKRTKKYNCSSVAEGSNESGNGFFEQIWLIMGYF